MERQPEWTLIRKRQLTEQMERVRVKTLRLLDSVPEAFFRVRVHDFYSPIGWHFGHIGMTEDYWVLQKTLGKAPLDKRLNFLFANVPDNPKDDRVHLPSREEIIVYLDATRRRTLLALEQTSLHIADELIWDGYAWDFAQQHECQHQETIAEMLQLIQQKQPVETRHIFPIKPDGDATEMIEIPGGAFTMGSGDTNHYDNEQPEHTVTVSLFALDRTPVTAGQWVAFMQDGGYRDSRWWSADGWQWRQAEQVTMPEYWVKGREKGTYAYQAANGLRAIPHQEPVSSVSWYEADAFAKWRGKRLPTEAEWEFAARYDPNLRQSRMFPWGAEFPTPERADCDLRGWGPLPVGTHPTGASAFGVQDMAGGVWEWTASPFLPYPGFEAFPYDGYSKDHMDGKHFVCRGGSWASDGQILRCSFRNWYVPTYRQGFLGLRCAL